MNDVRGIPLAVGDRVVWSNGTYADLRVGFVVGFTPKRIKVDRILSGPGIIKSSEQVAKVG